MTDAGRLVFAFKVYGEGRSQPDGYRPASLYREGSENPYVNLCEVNADNPVSDEEVDEMIEDAFDALPKPPEEYDGSDAGLAGWVRFDYDALVNGDGDPEPINVVFDTEEHDDD